MSNSHVWCRRISSIVPDKIPIIATLSVRKGATVKLVWQNSVLCPQNICWPEHSLCLPMAVQRIFLILIFLLKMWCHKVVAVSPEVKRAVYESAVSKARTQMIYGLYFVNSQLYLMPDRCITNKHFTLSSPTWQREGMARLNVDSYHSSQICWITVAGEYTSFKTILFQSDHGALWDALRRR